MLRYSKQIERFAVDGANGAIGRVRDILFDDVTWCVRYVQVQCDRWFGKRSVLLSPTSVDGIDWPSRSVHLALTRDEVRDSPGIDTSKPVSRLHEGQLADHYGWSRYWLEQPFGLPPDQPGQPGLGMPVSPTPSPPQQQQPVESMTEAAAATHLRATREVRGYRLRAADATLGRVRDFLIDEECWDVQYLVAGTRRFLPGKRVLVSREWFDGVDWARRRVYAQLTKEQVRNAPPWRPTDTVVVSRDYEQALHDHYQLTPYWQLGGQAATQQTS